MQIHAYRRKEPTPVELFGLNYLFAPNEKGHCVATVEGERAVARFLQIPEAYREYDAGASAPVAAIVFAPVPPVAPPPAMQAPAADTGAQSGEPTVTDAAAADVRQEAPVDAPPHAEQRAALDVDNPLVLTNGDQTVDLSDWTAKQVREFAAENNVELPKGNSTPVGELRLLLAKGLRGE